MRLVLLTTETTHHAYFAREVARHFPILMTFAEERSIAPPYPTAHPFEERRDAHEREIWFAGGNPSLSSFSDCQAFTNLNHPGAVQAIKESKADVGLVFGTGRLGEEVMAACPVLLNLHGGDPEAYRGLDTHLWAIWHRDFSALVTTLHLIARELDTGDIVDQAEIGLSTGMEIHQLRAANTGICLELSLKALRGLADRGKLAARAQMKSGRYYSFMPAVLKEVCVEKFARHCASLSKGAGP